MAIINSSGAPNKNTVGNIGDIYINSTTGDKFKCASKIEFKGDEEYKIEYIWENMTSSGSFGFPLDENGVADLGEAGQVIASDGNGGVVWRDLINGEEVLY